MAVHPDAEVATGIQRLAAERTRRPSGLDERCCGSGEAPGMCGSEPNAQEVRAVWFIVGDLGVVTILVDGPRFDQERSGVGVPAKREHPHSEDLDHRKSTRLNSSHMSISYAVFCLKKKKNRQNEKRYKLTNTYQPIQF